VEPRNANSIPLISDSDKHYVGADNLALEPTGAMMVGSTPAEFKAFVAEEINFIKTMVKELGIKPEL